MGRPYKSHPRLLRLAALIVEILIFAFGIWGERGYILMVDIYVIYMLCFKYYLFY